jgi:hypothetical protein
MTQPAVNISQIDGALGILPASAGRLFALVGVSSSGPLNTPATYARIKDIVAAFGSGPLVEAAAHYVERYGRPVVLVRTAATATSPAGTVSAVTSVATGDAEVTIAPTPAPSDDHELVLLIVQGGEVGTAGITYQLSLDGGRTFGAVTALGTDTTIAVPGAGNVSFALEDEAEVAAGDQHTARTIAPNWNDTELGTALEALKSSVVNWEIAHIVGPIGATAFDAIELKFASMFAAGKFRSWIGNVRMPNLGETEAAYLTAVSSAMAEDASLFGALCAGACKVTSSVNGRKYRRPVSHIYAAREASVSEEINTADVNLGPLVGVSIRDVNGNPDEHDESLNPGLDDARFVTLRSWEGIAGVYVNRPRLFSPAGSDFYLVPHRRVMNLANAALRLYFIRRLNKPVLVDKTTGFILESDAIDIELGATKVMSAVLLAKPKASAALFTLNRHENILSSLTLNGQARITPLAYPETINLDVGFYNPALQVISQAA